MRPNIKTLQIIYDELFLEGLEAMEVDLSKGCFLMKWTNHINALNQKHNTKAKHDFLSKTSEVTSE